MRFVPGSHRLGSLGRRDLVETEPTLEEILTPEDLALVSAPVTVPLSVGDVTAHDGLCLHGAGPNMSEFPRRAWSCIFIPGDTLWNGAPFTTEHANFYSYGLKPFQRFDHPDLMVA
jgi:ectoine hydroxylase-related dioxygenase (phytanoyl-CoA dioxygenase family)